MTVGVYGPSVAGVTSELSGGSTVSATAPSRGGKGIVPVDRVVLVTGANRGIGQAIARLLAEHGYTVFGTARRPVGESVDGYQMVQLDVTSEESVAACVSAVVERAGRIDVLVNNAAASLIGAAEEAEIADTQALFDVNLFGVARMVNAVLPAMRERRSGLIINFGSLGATLPIPFHGWLSGSKAAVTTYSDALRLELKPLGIDVSVIEPGMTATHPGERFADIRVTRSIDDYAEQEQRATTVMEHGQSAGADPRTVAETALRIIRSATPAPHYPAGREKWLLRLARILPPAAVESLISRRFALSR
jgi:short-subunit dehydrogenase